MNYYMSNSYFSNSAELLRPKNIIFYQFLQSNLLLKDLYSLNSTDIAWLTNTIKICVDAQENYVFCPAIALSFEWRFIAQASYLWAVGPFTFNSQSFSRTEWPQGLQATSALCIAKYRAKSLVAFDIPCKEPLCMWNGERFNIFTC